MNGKMTKKALKEFPGDTRLENKKIKVPDTKKGTG